MEDLKVMDGIGSVEPAESGTARESEKKPFFEKEATCPVCKETSVHYYLRDRSYSIARREEDYFISDYKWVRPEYNVYNLHAFGLWHCTHCKFTDERKIFYQKDMTQGRAQFDYVKKALRKQREMGDPFLEAIDQSLHYPAHDLLNALTLSLLAVYVHSLPEPLFQNSDKIAKHYLRTAWLFRVCSQKPDLQLVEKFLTTFNVKIDRLQANVMNTLGSLEDVNECIFDHNKDLSGAVTGLRHWNQHFLALNNNYSLICAALDKVITTMKVYSEISEDLNQQLAHAEKTLLETPYSHFAQYQQFLEELQQIWPEVPLNENMALEKASGFFLMGLHSKTYEFDMLKKLRIYELVITLGEKSGDYHTALEICEQLEKLTVQFQQKITQRLRKQEIIKDETVDPQHLNMLLKRCQEVIRTVGIKKKRLQSLKARRDEIKAQTLFGGVMELSEPGENEPMAGNDELELLSEKGDSNQKSPRTVRKKGLFERFRF